MILALLLALAPAEITLQAGVSEQLPIQTTQQVYVDKPLIKELQNNQTLHVHVPNTTTPGTYETYLYVATRTQEPIVAATSHPVTLHVQEAPEKKSSPSKKYLYVLAATLLALTGLLYTRLNARSAAG